MTHKIQLVNISYWKELGAERESNAARGGCTVGIRKKNTSSACLGLLLGRKVSRLCVADHTSALSFLAVLNCAWQRTGTAREGKWVREPGWLRSYCLAHV